MTGMHVRRSPQPPHTAGQNIQVSADTVVPMIIMTVVIGKAMMQLFDHQKQTLLLGGGRAARVQKTHEVKVKVRLLPRTSRRLLYSYRTYSLPYLVP